MGDEHYTSREKKAKADQGSCHSPFQVCLSILLHERGRIPPALANPQKHLQWKLLVCVRVTSPIGKQHYNKNRTLCQWMPYTHTANLQWVFVLTCACPRESRQTRHVCCWEALGRTGVDRSLPGQPWGSLPGLLPSLLQSSVCTTHLWKHSEYQQVLTHLRTPARSLLLRLMSHFRDS